MSNIQTINFNNQQLLTVEKDGIKYVAVKPICENLGLAWSSQRTKIVENHVLSEGVTIIDIPSEGGPQQTVCLPIDMINGWLFTINPNKVSEEIKPLVIYYQKECYKALFEFWNKPKEQEPPKPVEPAPQAGSFKDKFDVIKALVDNTSLSPVAKETLLITSVEENLGIRIPYRPVIERKAYSAKEIGDKLGISANMVGRIANDHGLKTEEFGRRVLSKSMYSSKQVEQFLYYEEVIPVIKNILEEN